MKKHILHIFLITLALASCAPNNKPKARGSKSKTMINVQKQEKEKTTEVVLKTDTIETQAKNEGQQANSDNTEKPTAPIEKTVTKRQVVRKSKAKLLAESRFEQVIKSTLGKGSFKRSIVNCANNAEFCTDNISENWLVKGIHINASKITAIDKDTVLRIKYCQLEGKYQGRNRAYKVGRVEEWIVADVQAADNIIRKLDGISKANWQKIHPQKVTYWRDQETIFIIQPEDAYSAGFADALKKDMRKR